MNKAPQHDRHLFFLYAAQALNGHHNARPGSTIHLVCKELAHRLYSILRLRDGEQVQLFSQDYALTLTLQPSPRPKDTIVATVNTIELITPPSRTVTAAIGLLKKESFEEAVHHATVTGATHIQPIITSKSRRGWLNDREPERLTSICIAAAEQSKNKHLPILHNPLPLASVLQHNAHTNLIGFEAASPQNLSDLYSHNGINKNNLTLFIGPEGGFTTAEIDEMRSRKVTFYTLTPTILRSQEAVCVAVAIVCAEKKS